MSSNHGLRILAIPGLVGILLLMISCGVIGYEKRAVARAIEELGSEGFPMRWEELELSYEYPSNEENGATLIANAFEQFEAIDSGGARLDVLWATRTEYESLEAFEPEFLVEVSDYLDAMTSVLADLRNVTDIQTFRYPILLTDGLFVELPHLKSLRHVVRTLLLASETMYAQGNTQDAMAYHLDALNIVSSLRSEPVLISQLHRIRLEHLCAESLCGLISHAPLSIQTNVALQNQYAGLTQFDAWSLAMAAEQCVVLNTLRDMLSSEAQAVHPEIANARLWLQKTPGPLRSTWLMLEQRNVLRAFAPWELRTERDWTEVLSSSLQVLERSNRIAPISSVLFPAYARAPVAFVRAESTSRLVVVMLEIERYRLDKGSLPGSTDQLSIASSNVNTIDPFDDKPLRYKITDGGYIVYSVYADMKDNGGAKLEYVGKSTSIGDWALRINR